MPQSTADPNIIRFTPDETGEAYPLGLWYLQDRDMYYDEAQNAFIEVDEDQAVYTQQTEQIDQSGQVIAPAVTTVTPGASGQASITAQRTPSGAPQVLQIQRNPNVAPVYVQPPIGYSGQPSQAPAYGGAGGGSGPPGQGWERSNIGYRNAVQGSDGQWYYRPDGNYPAGTVFGPAHNQQPQPGGMGAQISNPGIFGRSQPSHPAGIAESWGTGGGSRPAPQAAPRYTGGGGSGATFNAPPPRRSQGLIANAIEGIINLIYPNR